MDETSFQKLDARLDNWGAWARSGVGSAPGRCGSAEGRYLPPRDDDGERLDRSARPSVDVADAEFMEQCILKLRTGLQRRVLAEWYVRQADKIRLAKMINCAPMMVRPYLLGVMGALQYHLEHTPGQVLSNRRMKRGLQSAKRSNMYGSRPLTDTSTAP